MTNETYLRTLAAILKDAAPHDAKESPLLVQMLIYIALNPGCCTRELEREFSVNQATISRTSMALRHASFWGRRPNRKKGLVQLVQHSGRMHVFELTDVGERYLSKLARRIAEACSAILSSHV